MTVKRAKQKKQKSQFNLWIDVDLKEKIAIAHKEFMDKHKVKVSISSFALSLLEKAIS